MGKGSHGNHGSTDSDQKGVPALSAWTVIEAPFDFAQSFINSVLFWGPLLDDCMPLWVRSWDTEPELLGISAQGIRIVIGLAALIAIATTYFSFLQNWMNQPPKKQDVYVDSFSVEAKSQQVVKFDSRPGLKWWQGPLLGLDAIGISADLVGAWSYVVNAICQNYPSRGIKTILSLLFGVTGGVLSSASIRTHYQSALSYNQMRSGLLLEANKNQQEEPADCLTQIANFPEASTAVTDVFLGITPIVDILSDYFYKKLPKTFLGVSALSAELALVIVIPASFGAIYCHYKLNWQNQASPKVELVTVTAEQHVTHEIIYSEDEKKEDAEFININITPITPARISKKEEKELLSRWQRGLLIGDWLAHACEKLGPFNSVFQYLTQKSRLTIADKLAVYVSALVAGFFVSRADYRTCKANLEKCNAKQKPAIVAEEGRTPLLPAPSASSPKP